MENNLFNSYYDELLTQLRQKYVFVKGTFCDTNIYCFFPNAQFVH